MAYILANITSRRSHHRPDTWQIQKNMIDVYKRQHKVLEGTKKQFGILKKLMRDSKVDEVICATDAGREGELIFRLVYELAGCKMPMKRLWISSMEEQRCV